MYTRMFYNGVTNMIIHTIGERKVFDFQHNDYICEQFLFVIFFIFLFIHFQLAMESVATQQNQTNNFQSDSDANKNQHRHHSDSNNSNNLIQQLEQNLSNLIISEPPTSAKPVKQEPQPEQQHEEQQEYFTRDLMDISRNNINFNKSVLFPGSIDEVQVQFGLRQDIEFNQDPRAAYLVKVKTICHNTQFNDLDQYVVSVRSTQRYEYFQQIRFRIKVKEKAGIKVAIKIPPVRQGQVIQGTLSIQLQNTVPVFLEIFAKCQVPKIICLKDLYDVKEKTHLIKIPAKKSVRMPPIPFKNLSPYNLILEVQLVSDVDFSRRPYDVIAQNSVSAQANNPFFVNVQLKTNPSYRGVMPLIDTLRSSVYYSFPVQAYIFQSQNSSGMS